MAFQTQDSEIRPTLIGVTTFKSIGQLEQSKPDPQRPDKIIYSYNQIQLRGAGGMPDIKFRLLYLPEFFRPDFRMASLNKSSGFVYGNTVASRDRCTLLQGLCGDKENWERFQEESASLSEYTPESVSDFIREFLITLGPQPLLSEYRQERRKETAADGTTRYVRGRFYELYALDWVTEQSAKALAKRLLKNAEKIEAATQSQKEPPPVVLAKFNPADYGIDVELPEPAQPAWTTA